MGALTTEREQRDSLDGQRMPVAVPPAYPDPETWRRFGLFRRQLQRGDRVHATAAGSAGKQL
ncbi:MAG TPA: hypothetical protein VIU62_23395 [Chloroflexota bacterium]|jgi:hypothetical protein